MLIHQRVVNQSTKILAELKLRRNPAVSICQLLVEPDLRRNPVVSNYQLLVGFNLRRNPVVSIDKLLVELKFTEKSSIVKLPEELN